MKTFIQASLILLFTLIASSCSNSNTATNNAQGVIKVREADGIRECGIPAIPGDYVVSKNGCTNDQAYTVRFVDVPSALNITFFDDKNDSAGTCKNNEGWEIEVRTLKNPTTTPAEDYINLTSMANVPDNSLVVPGILKIRYRPDGSINGKLSCVRVENNK